MPYPLLFTPGRIGTLRLKNRLVMPPMVRDYADKNGLVTKRYVDHIASIAKGGVGMMILEASYINKEARGFSNQLGIQSDKTIPGLKRLAKAAHASGAKIGVQIYHAGRQTHAATIGTTPVGPSAIADPTTNEIPRVLTEKDIKGVVRAYAAAALRGKKAGMDFVEIHGAHGYLITQFLSAFSNKRTDAYGGTPDKRMRFLQEVYMAVRKAVGPAYPIVVRLSGDELVGAKGLRIADTKHVAKWLERAGANALHISAGNYATYARGLMIMPMAIPDGPLLKLAASVKKAVDIPVIAVGKIRTPQMAELALKTKQADYIAIGRTLLADPAYPNKVKAGKMNEVNPCIACNQGCISRLFAGQDVWCTVNPACGREAAFAKKKGAKKRVLVIGGGPAGLSAAKTAALRGHAVTLFEKQAKLGGQVISAASLPFRADWQTYLDALIRDVKRLGVTIKTKTDFCAHCVKKGEYDAAIVAIGSMAATPNIPGANRPNVVLARDVVSGTIGAEGRVVIVGGGCMGGQVAEALATKGHSVTVIEQEGAIATDAPIDDRILLLGRLAKRKVKIMTDTTVLDIGERSVSVQDTKGISNVAADTVVLCLGSIPNGGIVNELKPLVKKVRTVGDAKKPRRVTEAVLEGALAALEI
ncbi:MAG: FAD-dependent oxidoreductase [Patescibacteria group bacterium]